MVPPVKAVCKMAHALLLTSRVYHRLLMYSEPSLDMADAEQVEEKPQMCKILSLLELTLTYPKGGLVQ